VQPDLSFDQAPPISVPYRFFLTAPWFSVIAGLLLVIGGDSALSSRWMPETLALTHLIAAGFMLQAMCGALLQFVPVATGRNVWRPQVAAGIVHPLIILGTLLLCAGLLWGESRLLLAAIPLLMVGAGSFILVVGQALWRTPATGATVACLRLAIISLAPTIMLGAFMAEGIAWGRSLPQIEITSVHLGWGLGGWACALLAGVSLQVVPMFQMTPPYPVKLSRYLAPVLATLLILWSGQWPFPGNSISIAAAWGLVLLPSIYALTTVWLQTKRKRKVTDSSFWFFRGAMLCFLLAALIWSTTFLSADMAIDPRIPMTAGILVIAGGFVSAISGMLYKIAPFIIWLHLQRLQMPINELPNMKQMIPTRSIQHQMVLHFLATGLVLLAVWIPALSRPAGMAWIASSSWLGINLWRGAQRYMNVKDQIRAGAACPE
jgi:hypothetical protein